MLVFQVDLVKIVPGIAISPPPARLLKCTKGCSRELNEATCLKEALVDDVTAVCSTRTLFRCDHVCDDASHGLPMLKC